MNNNIEIIKKIFYRIIATAIGNDNKFFVLFILIASFLILIYRLLKYPKITLMMIGAILYQFFVFIFVYTDLSPNKVNTVLLVIFFFEWILRYDKQFENAKNKLFLIIILTFNALFGIELVVQDITCSYSNAKATASYINKEIPQDSNFIVSGIPYSLSIIPFTSNYRFWSPQIEDYFTFCTWNDESIAEYEIPELENRIRKAFFNNKKTYFIYCFDWNENSLNDFIKMTNGKLLYENTNKTIQKEEKYRIYKLFDN